MEYEIEEYLIYLPYLLNSIGLTETANRKLLLGQILIIKKRGTKKKLVQNEITLRCYR